MFTAREKERQQNISFAAKAATLPLLRKLIVLRQTFLEEKYSKQGKVVEEKTRGEIREREREREQKERIAQSVQCRSRQTEL